MLTEAALRLLCYRTASQAASVGGAGRGRPPVSEPSTAEFVADDLLRGRPKGVASQAPELRECEIGITLFGCPRDIIPMDALRIAM
jgi:hypothetical protein